MVVRFILAAIACLSVFSFAALPEIRITTQGNQNPDGNSGGGGWGMPAQQSYKYFALTSFQLTDPNNNRNNISSNTNLDSIKVRGNSTAGQAKKPYRIKFGEKKAPFGKEAARSWVLLANYYDATFTLNAIAFELGQKMGLEFTNSYQMVDLYINDTYKGIYQLTEQIQSHKGRVDLKEKHKGWLVEFDYHPAENGEYKFTTSKYNMGTFVKYPELDDTIPNRPTSYVDFVKNDLNKLVDKMSESGFPTNGYRDMIDLDSWAKYTLIQLFMDNFDFNGKAQQGALGSNYAYRIEECDRIKAGPLWDFDLAAGVTVNGFAKHYNAAANNANDAPITPTHSTFSHAFYKRLWEDPVFKAKYKKAWTQYKSTFQAISSNGGLIDNIKSQVEASISKGNQWANNSSYGSTAGTLTTNTFNTEVTGLKNWWNSRITFADQQFASLDASADITQAPLVCSTSSSSSANGGSVSSSSVASTQVTLSCTNLQAYIEKGGTIAEPTLTCSNGSPATNPNWLGRPSGNTSWTQNATSTTTSYRISVSATCGTVSGLEAACGVVMVGSDPSPIIKFPQIASDNRILAIKNGVSLQVQNSARVDIYSLSGKLQKSMNFGSGVYSVPLGDLPKGMYVAKVLFGNEMKTLRVPVM